ncbi:hypothetical protein [Sphingomonas sp. PB4P5]|uniref:hypothetical protein n=1 Tax=Parasphingomonas puruogangriensis TaxID=3096155 RepID=UPI002FC9C283
MNTRGRAWIAVSSVMLGTAILLSASEIGLAQAETNSLDVGAVEQAKAQDSSDASHATIVGALRRALVGTATLDGTPITDVQLRSQCTTAFVTAKGATVIDWSKVGNFAGRIDGKQAILPISDGNANHVFAMPEGDGFRGVDGSMGLLANECGGPM